MRVILIGPRAVRDQFKLAADPAVEIVAEAGSIAEGRAATVAHDALLLPRDQPPEDEGDVEQLTAREIEVLELLAEGLSNKGIAARLGISDQTVKFHVASVAGKLGAQNRTDAVRQGVRRGLIAL